MRENNVTNIIMYDNLECREIQEDSKDNCLFTLSNQFGNTLFSSVSISHLDGLQGVIVAFVASFVELPSDESWWG